MTAPIKDCPQPDAPELVMRADGYHYQEDEMKELTNEQIEHIAATEIPSWFTDSKVKRFARAAIAADRALNAPADLEHQSVGKPVAWLLTDKKINDIQVDSVQRLIDRARQAHFTDLIIRINGKDEHYQADWLKHLVRAEAPVCAPADRDVMRQALEEIALAGMSSSPEMSPYYVQSWHASRAWEFIGIAARALAAAPSPPADQPPKELDGIDLVDDLCFAIEARAAGQSGSHRIAELKAELIRRLQRCADEPRAEQQGEQEPVAWLTPGGDVTRSKVFADEQSALSFGQQRPTPLYTQPSPSLAELRAKVEKLPVWEWEYSGGKLIRLEHLLALIDKMGEKV